MMLFAIVFGLSMDYEVFLLSRIREEWDRTGDSRTSVADGLAATARVITAAAAIMVVVFGSFIGESDRVVKLFGVGLSMAVLIDATIVRLLLVPATMELLGDRNWWLPKWLARILPRVHIEAPADLDAELAQLSEEERARTGGAPDEWAGGPRWSARHRRPRQVERFQSSDRPSAPSTRSAPTTAKATLTSRSSVCSSISRGRLAKTLRS